MKKVICNIILTMLIPRAWSQDAFFKSAFSKGRNFGEIYKAENTTKKVLDIEKIRTYCDRNGLMLADYTHEPVSRFGDVVQSTKEWSFLPQTEYEEYLFERMHQEKTPSFKDLNKRGIVYVFHQKAKGKVNSLDRCTDVRWSGDLDADGKIQGKGVGFAFYKKQETVLYFQGNFKNGLPVGRTTFWFTPSGILNSPFTFDTYSYTCQTGDFSDGLMYIRENDKYGFLDKDGNLTILPTYSAVIQDFYNGRAIVSRNDTSEIIINKDGVVLGVTEKQQRMITEKIAARQKAEYEERLAAEEAERQARIARANAEKQRVLMLKNATEGDRIVFCQDWESRESFFLFWTTRRNFTMKVICFVEKNVNNGERLLVRIAEVESSSDQYYNTPIIDGIKVKRGELMWIRPLNDSRWLIE